MAFIPAFSGDARRAEEARDKIRAARQFARRGSASPEMLAWLDAVEAETETRFGDTRKALQLIRHAEEIYATEEPARHPHGWTGSPQCGSPDSRETRSLPTASPDPPGKPCKTSLTVFPKRQSSSGR